ncbi:MAG: thioredoxin domain-containing protein [Acidobacteriota bacterium]|jgi:protein-disulfide isomerase
MKTKHTFTSYVAKATLYLAGMALFVLTVSFPAKAQEANKDVPITRQQADAILDELRQIHHLLENLLQNQARAAAPEPLPAAKGSLKMDGGYILGSKDAPLTMVEFTDYQCPFCRQFETATFGEIRKKYIDTGKLRFISLNLPLDIHSNALQAAEAVLCAGDQGEFWTMRDALFRTASKLKQADLLSYAQGFHLNMSEFGSCLESSKHKADIQKDIQKAASLRMSGTPSFLVGKTTADGVDGYIIVGAQPFAAFDAKLQEILASK